MNLSLPSLEAILTRIPTLTVGVVGDLFLDRYLDIDARLTEPSLETGLDAYQVVGVRPHPGAAGTVINNLIALGVQEVKAFAVIGDDGEGYELRMALANLKRVDARGILAWPGRRTPTYTKPMLQEAGRPPRELNRLDIKNRTPLPGAAEDEIIRLVAEAWPNLDALVVLDQVSEAECGAVTSRVREQLTTLAQADPRKVALADSRERICLFHAMWLKPNRRECVRAVGGTDTGPDSVRAAATVLARRAGRPLFCTCGEEGIYVVEPDGGTVRETLVPGVKLDGPIDPVGAGDSVSAALTCAIAAGASGIDAAAFANIVASITIQQIGTTGTASPEQIRRRWQEG